MAKRDDDSSLMQLKEEVSLFCLCVLYERVDWYMWEG